MTLADLYQLLLQMNLPVFYRQWTSSDAYPTMPAPPFICYFEVESTHFIADGQVYQRAHTVSVELYTDRKEPELEAQLEALLTAADLPFEDEEVWIEDEKMLEKIYDMELIESAEE